MAQREDDGDEKSEENSPRTTVENHGRYEIVEIPGVESDSVVVDKKQSPPELIVHAVDARRTGDDSPESASHVLELPSDRNEIPEAMADEIERERKQHMEHNV